MNNLNRRGFLHCAAWAGTGILWTMSGGIPRAHAVEGVAPSAGAFSFVQISDSHIGFNKEANPDPAATLRTALAKIDAMPVAPAFILHTGDITHLSKPAEFDTAAEILKQARQDIHFVPGEHDELDEGGKGYLARYGAGKQGDGWYSFDHGGAHFIALVNVANLTPAGFGSLGQDQLEWLEDDLKGRSASAPIVVFAHMPLWTIYPEWGWGTEDSARALSYLKPFGSVTVLNGHVHQVFQKVEGNVAFHTAMSTAFPQPKPGAASGPIPLKVPLGELRNVLGVRSVNVVGGRGPVAIADVSLS
jgi:3',5'-cyclic-AMP phosphodiesterase